MQRIQKITLEKCGSPALPGSSFIAQTTNARTPWSVDAGRWSDDVRLSDLEPRFTCQVCGHRGADIRPLFETMRMGTG
jgi:hypothetical protein